MKTIILDTDMDTDCDDAAALGIVHRLAERDECRLAGVVCSVPYAECVETVRAINRSFGADVPVGLVDVPRRDGDPFWQAYDRHRVRIATGELGFYAYHDAVRAAVADSSGRWRMRQPPDAVDLYRSVLAAASDGSVAICAIGTLTALAQLLASPPDEHSSLSGEELIRDRVVELVTMAQGWFPHGRDGFNWRSDPASAATVLSRWPTPITVSPFGESVLTGPALMRELPEQHAVRIAYKTFLGSTDRSRPSWDLIAAAYVVRALEGPFALSADRSLEIDPATAEHRWLDAPGPAPRRILAPIMSDDRLADWLESLLLTVP